MVIKRDYPTTGSCFWEEFTTNKNDSLYSAPIASTHEPVLDSPESTEAEVNDKIKNEEDQAAALETEARVLYTYGANGPVTVSNPGGKPDPITTSEQLYDYELRRKKSALLADAQRLKGKLASFTQNIKETQAAQKVVERNYSGTDIQHTINSVRTYLNRTNSGKSLKPAGKKGGHIASPLT